MTGAEGFGGDDVLREELARLLGSAGAPDAADALDALWIARLSGLEPVDWSLLGDGTDPTAPLTPADPPSARPDDDSAPDGTGDPDPPSARLHLPAAPDGTAPARPRGAHAIRVAQPRALPATLALKRALRPLRQTVPSAHARTLDVAATAAASGDTGLLLPVLRPADERRFSADLLIDTGTTMTVWRRLGDELRTLLARHGAFADVRAWALQTDGPEPTLAPFRRAAQATSPTRRWRQTLADPTGRRAVLVLTDGVGPAWYGSELCDTLADWSRRRPVTALQVLPSRLWHRTALRTVPVRARGTEATRATIEVRSSGPLPGVARGRAGDADRARIRWLPVLEVAGDWLDPWARLVSGRTTDWVPLLAAPLTVVDRPVPSLASDEPSTPAAWVERFEEGYTPEAFRLLRLLSAAPLSLPVMRLVQRTMLPASTPMHLAEIFLSGLLVRRTPAEPGEDPDRVLYDFRPGVREALLDRLTRTESLRVWGQVSKRVATTLGGVTDFGAFGESDGALEGRELPEDSRAFAEVELAVIGGIGGDHGEVAARLGWGAGAADAGPGERERSRRPWLFSWRRWRRESGGGGSVADGESKPAGAAEAVDASPTPDLAPLQVPWPPPHYVSRPEDGDVVRAIHRVVELRDPEHSVRGAETCVIQGDQGVGKSSLAAICALYAAGRFEKVRWIRAHNREVLLEDLTTLARERGVHRATDGFFPTELLHDLRVSLGRDRRWLLVYDGVTSETFAPRPGDPPGATTLCLPPYGYGGVLVTVSEGAHWPGATGTTVRLEDFTTEQALTYLRKALDGHRGELWHEDGELDDLVAVAGTNPLRLTQLVERLAATRQPVVHHLQDLLVGRVGDGFLRSLVRITKNGRFFGTGIAVTPDTVLTAGRVLDTVGLRVHDRGGEDFRVIRSHMRGMAPGLILLETEEDVLTAVPPSRPDSKAVVAVWLEQYTMALRAASSRTHPLPHGAVLIDADGRLRSMVVPTAEGTARADVTPELINRLPMPRRKPPELLFYLSYARSPEESRGPVDHFLDDLSAQLSDLTQSRVLGHAFDVPEDLGWQESMSRALAHAHVFVPLYSAGYFRSEVCGREWDAFSRGRQLRGERPAIVPVLWEPTTSVRLPPVARNISPRTWFVEESAYADVGLSRLWEGSFREYRRVVQQIARTIVEVARDTRLRSRDPRLFHEMRDEWRNVFEAGEEP
ncbi:SAV_2336 N-terminal domain-related protein [Streptomyces sp. NPDC049627]|uniref:SAV_2336 N-terminal domain-related protein n=1 Tax=Streptomyces sp. NPDC049627 TaxID=3365595 RepID=UPI003790C210